MVEIIGKFDGYPVKFDPDTCIASCKGVVFSLDQAISVSKGGSDLGTAKHVEHAEGLVKVDCLTDTLDNLKSLIKIARKQHEFKSKKRSR